MSAAIHNAEAATVRWLEGLKARRNVDKMGLGEKSMAVYYQYITKYIEELPVQNASAAAAWFKTNPSAPEFPPVIKGEELSALDSSDRTKYQGGLITCSNLWVRAKSSFRKLVTMATTLENRQQRDKESAPQDLYTMLLNSINAFRAVKPKPSASLFNPFGIDAGTSKTRVFFESRRDTFIDAIRRELEPLPLPIDIDYMLFRAKSVLAINIIMDMADYPVVKDKSESSAAFEERERIYSTKYLHILTTLLLQGAAAVNRLEKSPVLFPTLEVDETGLVIDIRGEFPDFEKRWGRSIYAFNISRRMLAKRGLANNGETKLSNSKLQAYSNQVIAYLTGDYWRLYPERVIEEEGKDPLAAHVRPNRAFENASVAAASAAVAEASAAAVSPVLELPAPFPTSGIARSAALIERVAAENAARNAEQAAARNAAEQAAREKAAANAAALAARQAAEIQRFSVQPGKSCFGIGCSRKGGRRRLKKYRKTCRRSKKRSTA